MTSNKKDSLVIKSNRILLGVIDPTPKGRKFFVGDMHGERGLFDSLLNAVDFDPTVDIVISTGDFIDRGLNSIACLSLIEEPWFKYVPGNHELSFINSIDELRNKGTYTISERMGNEWIGKAYQMAPNLLEDYARRLRNQPCALVHYGDQPHERFHVVHGSLSAGKAILTDDQIDDAVMHDGTLTPRQYKKITTKFTWESKAYDNALPPTKMQREHPGPVVLSTESKQPGLSLTICGHLIVPNKPVLALSHLHIDTGAAMCKSYIDCAMSLVEITNMSPDGFDVSVVQASPHWGIRRSKGKVPFQNGNKLAVNQSHLQNSDLSPVRRKQPAL